MEYTKVEKMSYNKTEYCVMETSKLNIAEIFFRGVNFEVQLALKVVSRLSFIVREANLKRRTGFP